MNAPKCEVRSAECGIETHETGVSTRRRKRHAEAWTPYAFASEATGFFGGCLWVLWLRGRWFLQILCDGMDGKVAEGGEVRLKFKV